MKQVRQIEELRREKETESKIKVNLSNDKRKENKISRLIKDVKEIDKNMDTFVERIQLQIIRNLELSIRNIHIAYEDKSNRPSSLGITLSSIALHVFYLYIFFFFSSQICFILLDNNIRLETRHVYRRYAVNS